MKPDIHAFTIPADRPFAQTLAGWLFSRYGGDARTLAELRVLLPNRRACRSLREAFLELSGGKPMLLPRIHPIGDWETDDLPPDLLAAEVLANIPPAINANRRLLLLTRLVMQFEKTLPAAQALQLARQLASFLDEVTRENRDIFTLPLLAPTAELAQHWQQTVDFLGIISVHWPRLLKEEGAIDPVDHRNRVLKAVSLTWQHTPPPYPVVAAGSTGTQPATAELLSVIARLPQGALVLPGLDKTMPEEEWEVLTPTHPQFALKQLLKHSAITRGDIENISASVSTPRVDCLRAIFQPAAATARWLSAELPLAEGLNGIQTIVADSSADEARMIAAALREVLETPGKTAALVTHDRALARSVAAQMQRFGIALDDSAGTPLTDTPSGVFLRLVNECVLSKASPVSLLALLRHPLAAAGRETNECRNLSRILDKEYLRGVRHENGLASLSARAEHKHPELYQLLKDLEQHFKPSMAGKSSAPEKLLEEHIHLSQWLASTPDETGENRLWAGDAGNQLATALTEISAHLGALPPMDPKSYHAFFEALLSDKVFRPRYGKHPRLHILSPIEARLQSFDYVILGGLNEDSWPARPAADPWMSRPMREAFGLPPLERTIGQSAHDFFLAVASAKEVLLTRAKKSEGKPTVASRWLVRMETLLRGKNAALLARMSDSSYLEQAKTFLDAPADMEPLARPEPKPPLAARPRRLSATDVEKWLRDPYIVYAKQVLRLRKLDPLDKEPNQLEFGNLVHEALKLFSDRYPKTSLLDCGREVFDTLLARPAVAALWWPRFEALAAWFEVQDKVRRLQGIDIITEREGSWPMDVDGNAFTFTTRIDRLELDAAGNATLVDYKTGSLPVNKDIEKGLAAQLPVEALIAMHGVCNPPLPRTANITALEYWRLAGSEENCEIKPLKSEAALMEQCQTMLTELVRAIHNPEYIFAAQTNGKLAPRYNDYEHLTRKKEWGEA